MVKKLTLTYILRLLADKGVKTFTTREFFTLFNLNESGGYHVLRRLEARGFVKRIARGHYVLGAGSKEVLGQAFFLGTRLAEPSYVSFWSALNFYGWTEQAPRVVLIANTRLSGRRRVEAHTFRFVRVKAEHLFGYTLVRQGAIEFPVADHEKAIVDSLWLPSCSGGTDEVAKAMAASIEELDAETLMSYALNMNSRSLCSRLGYLLEKLGANGAALQDSASKAYVKLDPAGPRRGRYSSKWRILDNIGEVT
jgi:predicted transcriptional regulator of viral defense system